MIGYTTVGTNDLNKAGAFYDAIFGALGGVRIADTETRIIYARSPTEPAFGVCNPFDGEMQTIGNGTMIALKAKDRDEVAKIHQIALELGAKDEGQPGVRSFPGFYGAYFRDLDGNKLAIYILER